MGSRNGLWLLGVVATSMASASGCKEHATGGAAGGSGGASSSHAASEAVGGRNAGASPCAVVTEKDATAALGSDPGPGEASVTAAGTGRCTYTSAAGSVMITVTPNQTQDVFTRAHDKAAKDAHAGSFAEVPEVAHGAFSTWGGPMASVQFYKGSTAVYIMLTLTSHPTSPKSQVNALGVAAAGRV